MTQTIITCSVMIIGALLYILLWLAWDKYITLARLKQNQKVWDEYSKGMTNNEKWNCYESFCEEQKIKNNWQFYYFPKM